MRFSHSALIPVVWLIACTVPTERSSSLVVEMSDIPQLIRNDTVTLAARVLDDGVEVSNAVVRFSSDADTVVSITDDGHVLAVKAGDATVSATAVQFQDAHHAVANVHVRDLFELDSIRPAVVRYGETIQLYGVGINPGRLLAATLGGVDAIGHSYQPEDPEAPDRFGTLSIWATPPAPQNSAAILLGLEGLLISDPINIVRRDLYEPNDSVPFDLGILNSRFHNPALAFERIRRGDSRLGVDWYTFTTATESDVTISAWAPTGGLSFDVYVVSSLAWSPVTFASLGYGVYSVQGDGWAVGRGFRPCDGLGLRFRNSGGSGYTIEVPPDSAVMALRDLPAGTYNVFVNYADGGPFFDKTTSVAGIAVFVDSLNLLEPLRYGLNIQPGYRSALAADRYEENDYCNPDQVIAVPDTIVDLTIDTPHDADWYRFEVTGTDKTVRFSVEAEEDLADLDYYVVRDFRPDSLVVVGFQFGKDDAQTAAGAFLEVGDYFLIVVDFIGVPTPYTLRSEIIAIGPSGLDTLPVDVEQRTQMLRDRRVAATRGNERGRQK
jgi:hypothetical protein